MNSERPGRSSGLIEPAGKPLTIDDIRKAEVAASGRISGDVQTEEEPENVSPTTENANKPDRIAS